MQKEKYWIGVVSRDYVINAVEGNYCHLCHGKASPLQKMKPGDWIIYYSSKLTFEGQEPYQKFTAIGKIKDYKIYEVDMRDGFMPYRKNAEFIKNVKELDIRELINDLKFIEDKKSWGYYFRFGHLEIPKEDFELIKSKMLD